MTGRWLSKALVTILLATPFLNGCENISRPEKNPNVNSVFRHGIEYKLESDKYEYNLGETVELTYSVINTGNRKMHLGRIPGCEHVKCKFSVKQGSNTIWRNATNPTNCELIDFYLDPQESRLFQANWNQMNYNGTDDRSDDFLINPGKYKVSGELNLLYWGGVEVPIEIKVN